MKLTHKQMHEAAKSGLRPTKAIKYFFGNQKIDDFQRTCQQIGDMRRKINARRDNKPIDYFKLKSGYSRGWGSDCLNATLKVNREQREREEKQQKIKNLWQKKVDRINKRYRITTDIFSLENFPHTVAKEAMKALKRRLIKCGWDLYHTSKEYGRVSSYYFERRNRTLRLSTHELPNTPERQYYINTNQRRGWDQEIIIKL